MSSDDLHTAKIGVHNCLVDIIYFIDENESKLQKYALLLLQEI